MNEKYLYDSTFCGTREYINYNMNQNMEKKLSFLPYETIKCCSPR